MTLIVYLGGDNNLSLEAEAKISAIQSFFRNNSEIKSEQIKILIYKDVPNQPSRLYRCVNGSTEAVLLTTYGRENSASAAVFSRVLADCRQIAPADRYGLLVFSHASGWLPEGTLNNPNRHDTRSVITDGIHEMDIKDFAASIPDRMFDYIVFEACFMAGVEVAYELKDKTNYIMASAAEMLSPGFTNIYPEILAHLTSGGDIETSLVGAAGVYFNHFDHKIGVERSATISVIKTSGLDELARQVQTLRPYDVNTDESQVQHFDRNGNRYHLFFDLEGYVAATTSTSLASTLAHVVLYKRATADFLRIYSGFEIKSHCGLTTYIPQERFLSLHQAYQKLNWYRAVQ